MLDLRLCSASNGCNDKYTQLLQQLLQLKLQLHSTESRSYMRISYSQSNTRPSLDPASV